MRRGSATPVETGEDGWVGSGTLQHAQACAYQSKMLQHRPAGQASCRDAPQRPFVDTRYPLMRAAGEGDAEGGASEGAALAAALLLPPTEALGVGLPLAERDAATEPLLLAAAVAVEVAPAATSQVPKGPRHTAAPQ